MGVVLSKFPAGIDDHLRIPKTPSVAKLSESESPSDYGYEGQNENSHSELHDAENRSIQSIESSVMIENSSTSHDHSDPVDVDYSSPTYATHPDKKKGRKLLVQNTHVFSQSSAPFYKYLSGGQLDYPDSTFASVHHSLGSDDSVGDRQGVSGQMWKAKGLQNLSGTTLSDITTLPQVWDSRLGEIGTDKLVSYIATMATALADLKDSYESQIAILSDKVDDLTDRLSAIEDRMPSGTDTLAHGNINIYSGTASIQTHDGDSDNDLYFG
jgi:hypothetical protein